MKQKLTGQTETRALSALFPSVPHQHAGAAPTITPPAGAIPSNDGHVAIPLTIPASASHPDGVNSVVAGLELSTRRHLERILLAKANQPEINNITLTSPQARSGANGTVHAVAIQADGKVLIGGEFTEVNGFSRNSIAKLNANGAMDEEFNPSPGVEVEVENSKLTGYLGSLPASESLGSAGCVY
jgi:hypothetical protein